MAQVENWPWEKKFVKVVQEQEEIHVPFCGLRHVDLVMAGAEALIAEDKEYVGFVMVPAQ